MFRTVRNRLTSVVASRHVAGPALEDALRICRWAEKASLPQIVSPWGGPSDTSGEMFDRYCEAAEAVHDEKLNAHVSIKLNAIGYDPGMFDDLVAFAGSRGIRLFIDSLAPETAGMTLKLLERGASASYCPGFTLPSRWARSLADAERIVELGAPARLVKGQWSDPDAPGLDCRRNFLEIAARLAGKCRHVGVATHDVALAGEALRELSSGGSHCELEQFFSLPLGGMGYARAHGYPCRLYVPYGHPGIPYNMRFAGSRPALLAWFISDLAGG